MKPLRRSRRRLGLEAADVGLGVEDLAVEVAQLDPVEVDSSISPTPQQARFSADQPPRPPTPSTAIRAFASRSWHSDGRRSGGDVAEVAQLAVEALNDRLGDPVVVGGVLDHAQLLELGEQVADLVGAELLDQLARGPGPVEGGEQAPSPPSGSSMWMSAPALGRSR